MAALLISYETKINNCPIVLAKDSRNNAKLLIMIAMIYNIPIINNPKLIEEIFYLNINEELPFNYWKKIAEIFIISEKNNELPVNIMFEKNVITKKIRFIKKNCILSKREKILITYYLSKHPNYDKFIDWNNRNLTYNNFNQLFSLVSNSKTLLFNKFNCEIIYQTNEYLIVVPLDWKCAVYFNSFSCGGESAKWCIGWKNNDNHWKWYSENGYSFYMIYFFERHPSLGKKVVVELNHKFNYMGLWLQDNKNKWDISSTLSERLIEMKIDNPYKKCWELWFYHLQSEKIRTGQLYFDFYMIKPIDIFDEKVPDTTFVKNIIPLLIHDKITFTEIDNYDNNETNIELPF